MDTTKTEKPPTAPSTALQRVITGALFDFAAYLTCRPGTLTIGSTHESSPMVEVLKEWADLREISLDDAEVLEWKTKAPNLLYLATPPPGWYVRHLKQGPFSMALVMTPQRERFVLHKLGTYPENFAYRLAASMAPDEEYATEGEAIASCPASPK